MASSAFGREPELPLGEDHFGRLWADAYLEFAASEMRGWLRQLGVRFFPLPAWAERGGALPLGHGNRVPRFHITWGTGPGLLDPFLRRVREAELEGRLTLHHRHRVDELIVEGGRVRGAAGAVLEPSRAGRGEPSSRREMGRDFAEARSVQELVAAMNRLTPESPLGPLLVAEETRLRDRRLPGGGGQSLGRRRPRPPAAAWERLLRVAPRPPRPEPSSLPLITVRLRPPSRKAPGGRGPTSAPGPWARTAPPPSAGPGR